MDEDCFYLPAKTRLLLQRFDIKVYQTTKNKDKKSTDKSQNMSGLKLLLKRFNFFFQHLTFMVECTIFKGFLYFW